MIENHVQFFLQFIKSPLTVGSIIPSSSILVKEMLKYCPWDRIKVVVELGAGTGVMTEALSSHLRDDQSAIIFEKNEIMRGQLQYKFPNYTHYSDAEALKNSINSEGWKSVDLILSGLPFANFSQEVRNLILNDIYECLDPKGKFISFQYSLQMRKQLKEKFAKVDIHFVPFNIPPAFVYVCQK